MMEERINHVMILNVHKELAKQLILLKLQRGLSANESRQQTTSIDSSCSCKYLYFMHWVWFGIHVQLFMSLSNHKYLLPSMHRQYSKKKEK